MVSSDRTIRQITYLFHHLDEFAARAAAMNLTSFHPKQFDCYEYPLGVYWIGICKNQVKCIQEAFAALFIVALYDQNDWSYPEESINTKEWIVLLQSKWIEDYFRMKHRTLHMQPVDCNHFRTNLLHWMPENVDKKEEDSLNEVLFETEWVYSLFPDSYYDLYFGKTKDYYFFAESGVYD